MDTPQDNRVTGALPALLILALVSGTAALVYEVLFFRYLGLLFGVAIHAVAAVVCAFLGGLGLGAWLGGRLLWRNNPLRVYAVLELLTALFGFLAPWLFRAVARGFSPAAPEGVPWSTLCVALLLLLWPTMMMGATFPVLGRAAAQGSTRIAHRIGLLYGFNTTGAVLGAVGSAYLLLPRFGLSAGCWLAALSNLLLAAAAWLLARRFSDAESDVEQHTGPASRPATEPPSIPADRPARTALYLCVFTTGLVILAMQVLGNRLLISLLGGSVYTFAAVLAVFLAGIALGGGLGAGPLAERPAPLTALGRTCILLAGAIGLGLLLLRLSNDGTDVLSGARNLGAPADATLGGFLIHSGRLAGLAFLPATFLSGAILPAAARWLGAGGRSLSAGLGGLYGINTLGAVIGSLLAGFFLLPRLGLRSGFLVLALLGLLAALPPLLAARRRREPAGHAGTLAVLAAAAVLLFLGLRTGRSQADLYGETERFYAESPVSSVRVIDVQEAGEPRPVRCLFVNGKAVATSLFVDQRLQLLLGFLPSLIHEQPRQILSIALGTGMSSGALALSGADQVEIVELSRGVIDACPLFDEWTGKVLEQDNVLVHHDDGRAFLSRMSDLDRRYDLISADPIHPWVAGSAALFTREYYTLARSCLNDGGLMSQWIPLYELSTADIAGIVHTFTSVFPDATAWVTGIDMVLLGSQRPLRIDAEQIRDRMEREPLRTLLSGVGVADVSDLLACGFAGRGTLEVIAQRSPGLISDDHPWIEFTAPRSALAAGYSTEVLRLLAGSADPLPLDPRTPEPLHRSIRERRKVLADAAQRFSRELEAGGRIGPARVAYIASLRGAAGESKDPGKNRRNGD